MHKQLIFLIFTLTFVACNQREESKANTDLLYFDVKGYFNREAIRLNKINPLIRKEVSINNSIERKTAKVGDWEKEFSIFTNADINKTSWKGSFKIQKSPQFESYISNNKRIPVKKVFVFKTNNELKKIEVIIYNKNILYTSGDTLIYYPDSLYQIKKHQKIKLLKAKSYIITGKFK